MGSESPPSAPKSPVSPTQVRNTWSGATGAVGQATKNPYPMQTFQQFYPGMQSMYGFDPSQAVNWGNYISSMAPNLYGAGNQVMQTGFDPQQQLYGRMRQGVQDQARVSQAARGIQTAPYGAGLENTAMSNFDIDWQNQQLQRQLSALQGMGGAYQGGMGQALGGQALASSIPSTVANYVGGLQQLGMGAYAPQMWGAGQYGNLFGLGSNAQNQAYQNQLAQYNAEQQANQGMWGGLGSLGGTLLGAPTTSIFGSLLGF